MKAFIYLSSFLLVLITSCGSDESSNTKNTVIPTNEISCFVQFADKSNSNRSIKIISNVKQLLYGRCFLLKADGTQVEVKKEDANSQKHHFYDIRDIKSLESPNAKKIEVIFQKPIDGRDVISVYAFKIKDGAKVENKKPIGNFVYFPSDFELNHGVKEVVEEQVESRLTDIIIKYSLR